jgi:hypothetical protein
LRQARWAGLWGWRLQSLPTAVLTRGLTGNFLELPSKVGLVVKTTGLGNAGEGFFVLCFHYFTSTFNLLQGFQLSWTYTDIKLKGPF